MNTNGLRHNEDLHREVEELRQKNAAAMQYIRGKVNQLLAVMGTAPLRPEELDDATLIELDPIGIVSDSFVQVLGHLKETNVKLKIAHDEITAIFDSAGMGILVVDRDMRVLASNRMIVKQFEIEQALTPGVRCCELICRKDHNPDCPVMTAIETGRSARRQMDLGGCHFDVVATPIREKDGVVSRVVLLYMDMTERILAQESLRQSEERYRDLFENSTDLIQVLGADGAIRYVNRAWMATLGYGSEELTNLSIFDIIHPGCKECEPEFKHVVSGNKDGTFESMFITKDGRTIVVEGNVSPIMEGGTFVGTRGIFRNITDRKLAEDALKKSEYMLHTIIDAEPECVMLIDADANLLMMNRAGLSMIQVDSLEHVKSKFACMSIASDYREAFTDLTKRVFQGESGTLVFEMIGVKGRHLWLDMHAVPFRNEKNDIIALLGITRDITERKHAEDTLRRNEEMVRNILNSVDEGFIVVDRDYRILTANRAYCEDTGLALDDMVGEHCFKVSHKRKTPCYEESNECAVRKVFETGEPSIANHKHRGIDGNILCVETKAFPLKDATGNVTSVIESINDVTEKQQLEMERLKVQKLEAIGTLAGGIAHDFNNLLQGVLGYISLAKLAAHGRQKSLTALEQAEKALNMSVKLTNQLLTFSKGGKPVKKIMDLIPVIEYTVQFALSGSCSSYNIVADEELWQVEADEGQIGQVVQNIVLNANQAMPEGGRVEISARNIHIPHNDALPGLQKGRYVLIAIKDSGIGIPEQYITKIFDPYFTTKEKGSGLGLATSYSIIKNHGGMIDVQSEMYKGTTFSIYLPAFAAREKAKLLKPTMVTSSIRTSKVLVMDDEPIVRDVAGELIRALGHEVEFSAHGEEAIVKYQMAKQFGKPFDLVILDLTIRGGMGGAETIRKLMAIAPGVKAVVSSGYSDDDNVQNHQKQGFKAFLKKPYNVDELREVLDKVLNS